MEYPVIVERKNGVYKALIPDLSDLSAEGNTSDEAVQNVQRAATAYLARVELRTIQVQIPVVQPQRYSTARDWIEAAEAFVGDEEVIREHFAEIDAERQRQREEAQKQDDE
jgi:predicted RNase H-like HicB family nuclease